MSDAGVVLNFLPVVSGVTSPPAYLNEANLTFPLPVVAGPPVLIDASNVISPSLIVIGELASGQVITGNVQLPLPQVDVASGYTASVQPNIPVVIATGLTGEVGIGVVNNPRLQVISVSSLEAAIAGEVITARPVVFGEVFQGTLNIGDVQNKSSVINAIGLSGGISTGVFNLPLLEANVALLSAGILTGAILAPLPFVRGSGPIIVSDFVTWVLNTENNRVTNYSEFPFIALGLMGTSPIGAATDGLYLLAGDDDDGQLIDSVFKFGMTDFRSELVNNADVYVGGDMESDMEVGILEDGQDDENAYTLSERERHVRGHHAKLGKGFRSRYRRLSISNINGGNFDLDSLSLSSRDLRGNE